MWDNGEAHGLGHTQLLPLTSWVTWGIDSVPPASVSSSLKWKIIVEPISQFRGEDYMGSVQ